MLKIALIFTVFLLTFAGVEAFRRWSLQKKILDIPNERSSHENPTPVGGGLIIVLVSLCAFLVYLLKYGFQVHWRYFCGAVLIACISWLDDLFSVPVVIRFLFHGAAAALIILGFEDFSLEIFLNLGATGAKYLTALVFFLWIVWMVNAYNFMDGIDGIAAVQAITAGIGWFVFGGILNLEQVSFYGAVLAASSLGFLILNWQPAKIFMGDVGSAFFGYTFAVLPFMEQKSLYLESPKHFLLGVFLVWFFVFDTILTIVIRIIQKRKIWKAHREHLYQRLVIKGWTHMSVTILYGIFSLVVLFSIFFWIFLQIISAAYVFGIAVFLAFCIFLFARKSVIFERKSGF